MSGSKEDGGDGGPADADSGAPVAGDFPRRKRTRREREGARGAAAGSRLAAALNAQQLQQQQQLVLAQAQAQAGLAAGLPAGLLPMHLAAGNLSDLLVNYVGGPTSMAAAGPEDPAMRPPEMMVPAAAPLNTELPVESHDMHNPDLRQALQAEAEAAAIAAHASLAAQQNAAQQEEQQQQEQQQQAGPVSDALMMAPAEEVAALSGALQQEQQAGGEGQEGGGMQEGQAAQQQHDEEQQQAAAAAAAAQAAAAAAAIERKPRVYHVSTPACCLLQLLTCVLLTACWGGPDAARMPLCPAQSHDQCSLLHALHALPVNVTSTSSSPTPSAPCPPCSLAAPAACTTPRCTGQRARSCWTAASSSPTPSSWSTLGQRPPSHRWGTAAAQLLQLLLLIVCALPSSWAVLCNRGQTSSATTPYLCACQ